MTSLGSGIYAILDGDRLGLRTRTDARAPVRLLREYAVAAVEGGAIAVQLRLKHLPLGHPTRLTALHALRRALLGTVPVVADDDPGAARDAQVGLHLGQDDGDPRAARPGLAPGALLGYSTHTLAQVRDAARLPVDYIGFGPIRATDGKLAHDSVTGLDALATATAASPLPVVAIGGLDLADAAAVRRTGAHAMAVIGAWLGPQGQPWDAATTRVRMRALSEAWRQA